MGTQELAAVSCVQYNTDMTPDKNPVRIVLADDDTADIAGELLRWDPVAGYLWVWTWEKHLGQYLAARVPTKRVAAVVPLTLGANEERMAA